MNRLQYILDLLPTTPRGIAFYFRSRGIKGVKRDSNQCPIANYIKAETGEEHCSVGVSGIILGYIPNIERIGAPPHVLRFIEAFDSGDYDSIIFNPTQE